MRVARTWDSVPPEILENEEIISLRVLEHNHRQTHKVAVALLEYIDGGAGVDRDWVENVLAENKFDSWSPGSQEQAEVHDQPTRSECEAKALYGDRALQGPNALERSIKDLG